MPPAHMPLRGHLVLTLLLASLHSSQQRSKEGSPCPEHLTPGGSCVRLAHCPPELRRMLSGLPPTLCDTGPEPLVCCYGENHRALHREPHHGEPRHREPHQQHRFREEQGQRAQGGAGAGDDSEVWFPDAAAYTPSTRRPPPAPGSAPGPATYQQGYHYHRSRTTQRPSSYYHSSRRTSRPTDFDYNTNDFLLSTERPAFNNRNPTAEQGNRNGWSAGQGARTSPRPARPARPARPGWITEKKCAEYARLQTERVVALPLVPDPRPAVQHVQKCDSNSVPLVVGGQDARLHEFPHMAAIGYRGSGGPPGGPAASAKIEWNCGGSLISEMFVLTAAHCTATAQGPPIRVRLGEHNLESSEDGARPVDVAVSSMVRHPDYQPPSRYHDIGLLRLARKVPFNAAVRPACLYFSDQEPVAEPLVATGWGHTEQLGEKSQVLQKVNLNFVEHNTCSNLYASDSSTSSLSRGIEADSQLCAGNLNGGKDTCQGDSGGPLQVTSHNNKCVFHIVGITSFGKVCAARNSPGVYTRVSKYIAWIERHVWPEERWES